MHLRRARAAKDSFAVQSTRNQSTNLARQNIKSSYGVFLIFSSQFGNVCHINLTNRKRCQECRLAKCYQKVIPPSHMQGGKKHGDNKKVGIWLFLLAPLCGDLIGRLFRDNQSSPIHPIQHIALRVPNCSKLFQTALNC